MYPPSFAKCHFPFLIVCVCVCVCILSGLAAPSGAGRRTRTDREKRRWCFFRARFILYPISVERERIKQRKYCSRKCVHLVLSKASLKAYSLW
ncbi:hypothetical protein J3E69DRAFT_326857 [Trichoderma sp. SZMC 28015]